MAWIFYGQIVVGEEGKLGQQTVLGSRQQVGTGNGPPMDVVLDPIDGEDCWRRGSWGRLPWRRWRRAGCMRLPAPAVYMEKMVVSREAARKAPVTECMGCTGRLDAGTGGPCR